MRFGSREMLFAGVLAALLLGSCGKSEDESGGAVDLQAIARRAGGTVTLEEEVASIAEMAEAAGYEKKIYEPFPGQETGDKGRVLVYGGKGGKPPGGIIYINKKGSQVTHGWHWYFADMVPDSVVPVELNDDGLWDVRVVAGSRVVSLVQDESFSLMAGERADWIAMNGTASAPLSEGDALWKAFDGDTTTAWRSPVAAQGKAYVDIPCPFGVVEGVLSLRTLDAGQPKNCKLYADGKEIQQFELEAKAAKQMIQLDRGVVGARQIRLEFASTHGGATTVEIAELELK
ncbi:MAG: hypothetical protein ACE5EO_00365 [Candidatus Krumholzibacteriia bacterium]